MKRIVLAVLLVLFVGGVAQTCVADIKISDGKLLVSPKWEATDISVSPQARQYPKEVEWAYQNPGKTFVAKKNYKTEMVDLFHYRKVAIADPGVVYNDARGEIDTEREVLEVENHFTPYLIFWGISVLCAIAILFLLKFGENKRKIFVLATIFALFTAITSFTATTSLNNIVTFTATTTLAFVCIFAATLTSINAAFILAFTLALVFPRTSDVLKIKFAIAIPTAIHLALILISAGVLYYPLL